MKKPIRRSAWNKLRQGWRLAHDRKALGLANLGSFGPAFGFSTGFGWMSGGAQSWQQCVQPAAHLLRGTGTLLVFPGAQLGRDQVACQHQVIMDNGHQVAPALKLFG